MEVDVLTREGELAPIALDSVRLSIVAALAVVGVTAITCKLDLHLRNRTSYALTPSNLETSQTSNEAGGQRCFAYGRDKSLGGCACLTEPRHVDRLRKGIKSLRQKATEQFAAQSAYLLVQELLNLLLSVPRRRSLTPQAGPV